MANAILNQAYVTKENGTETIKVFNQEKNIYFELTMDTVTKEVTHYRSLPLNMDNKDVLGLKLVQ
ncbi:MAG: hypothetical protein KJO47_04920 [Gammaproteobacteria bacterium]|nr:hypothetical protein [Gammaproteobacteria bacterium]